MPKIRGSKNFLKAAIAITVCLAFILPGTAVMANIVNTNNNPLDPNEMTVEDTTGYIGSTVTVEVTGVWDDIIQAYQMEITFDETLLGFVSVDFTGTIADTYSADYALGNEFGPGLLSVGAVWFPGGLPDPFEDMPPAGSGTLAYLVFDVIATTETTTIVSLEDTCIYTDTLGANVYPTLTDGTVTILEGEPLVCGDADGNGMINISDAVFLISYIFGGGPAPDPLCIGDSDGNAIVNISDAVYLIAYIFGGGPTPVQSPGCPCTPI